MKRKLQNILKKNLRKELLMRKKDEKPMDIDEQSLPKKQESVASSSQDQVVISMLKSMQEQINYLEKKIDHLTNVLNRKEKESKYSSKFLKEDKRSSSKSKERKFTRRNHQDEDDRSSEGYSKKKKPSFGKSFGKPFGKAAGGKKKDFAFKKDFKKSKSKKVKKDI